MQLLCGYFVTISLNPWLTFNESTVKRQTAPSQTIRDLQKVIVSNFTPKTFPANKQKDHSQTNHCLQKSMPERIFN